MQSFIIQQQYPIRFNVHQRPPVSGESAWNQLSHSHVTSSASSKHHGIKMGIAQSLDLIAQERMNTAHPRTRLLVDGERILNAMVLKRTHSNAGELSLYHRTLTGTIGIIYVASWVFQDHSGWRSPL